MGACGSKQTAIAPPEHAVAAAEAPQMVAAPAPIHETQAAAVPDVLQAEILRLKADIMYVEHRMKDLSAEKANELKSKVTEMHANMAKLEDYLANQDDRAFDFGFVTDTIHHIRDSIVGILGNIDEAIGNAVGSVEAKIAEFTAWTSTEIGKIEEKIEDLAEDVVDKINGLTSACPCGMGMLNCCHDDTARKSRQANRPGPPQKPSWFEFLCGCQGCGCCLNHPDSSLDEHEIQMGREADRPGPPSPRQRTCFEYLCNAQGCRCCINPSPDDHDIHTGRQARKARGTPERKWFHCPCECDDCECISKPSDELVIDLGKQARKARGTPERKWFHCPCECDDCECTSKPSDELVIDLGKQVDRKKEV